MNAQEILQKMEDLKKEQRQLEAQFNFLNGQLTGKLNLLTELLQSVEGEEKA